MKLITFSLILIFSLFTFASDSGGDHSGLPIRLLVTQVVNFSIAVGLLIFFTRKIISNHFINRHEEFHAQVKKAEYAKTAAEKKKKAISERLNQLSNSHADTVVKAQSDAENIKNKIIAEANVISKKLADETMRTVKLEHLKAVEHLRQDMFNKSIKKAEQQLKTEIDGTVQKRMRGEFIKKIQVVQ